MTASTAERIASVQGNGLSIGYSVRGSGPPLVLIHGGEAGREMFSAFGDALAPHFTVFAYDQRDTNETRDLTQPPRDYGLADAGDDAAAFIRGLGLARAHVFGTSLGGHIAQVLAARHPECVDRLILASTFLAGTTLMSVNPETAEQMVVWRSDLARHAPDVALKFFPADYLRAHPEKIDMFRGGKRTAEQTARRSRLLGVPYPIAKGEIATKTLVLMNEKDALVPNEATFAVARLVKDPEIEILPGIGHIAAIQDPVALAAAVIAFLRPAPDACAE